MANAAGIHRRALRKDVDILTIAVRIQKRKYGVTVADTVRTAHDSAKRAFVAGSDLRIVALEPCLEKDSECDGLLHNMWFETDHEYAWEMLRIMEQECSKCRSALSDVGEFFIGAHQYGSDDPEIDPDPVVVVGKSAAASCHQAVAEFLNCLYVSMCNELPVESRGKTFDALLRRDTPPQFFQSENIRWSLERPLRHANVAAEFQRIDDILAELDVEHEVAMAILEDPHWRDHLGIVLDESTDEYVALRKQELRKRLGISETTLRNWLRDGKISLHPDDRHHARVKTIRVEKAWLEEHSIAGG